MRDVRLTAKKGFPATQVDQFDRQVLIGRGGVEVLQQGRVHWPQQGSEELRVIIRNEEGTGDYGGNSITESEYAAIKTEAKTATPERLHEIVALLLKVAFVDGDVPYDPEYGDDRMCLCGHPYHRHFDSYEDMAPVGCKYCNHCHDGEGGCTKFRQAPEEVKTE